VEQLEKSLNAEKNRNRSLTEKVRELQRQLFEYNISARVRTFLEECSPADTIVLEEETHEQTASGAILKHITQWEAGASTFDELYSDFCMWSSNSFNGDEYIEEIKNCFIEYQEKTYGLILGENERNGTRDEPRFDFKFETI
jgi:hypothetical protein